MEINKLHSDLKKIYQHKNIKYVFNFQFENPSEQTELIRLLKKGFWSVMPFAFDGANVLAIKLTPAKSIKKSSIVTYDEVYKECFIFAPDLQATIPISYLRFMDDSEVIAELQEKIDGAVNLSKPFFDYLGGGDLDFLKQFLLSEANQERFKDTVNL